MLTFSQRRSSSVALSSPASVLLRGGVTLQGLQPCAGHVFNRKLGGRGTGLRVHRQEKRVVNCMRLFYVKYERLDSLYCKGRPL